MLFTELGKIKRKSIMATIVLIFIGVVLMIIPASYISFLNRAIGFVLLTTSIVMMMEFADGPKILIRYMYLFVALLSGLGGLILLIFPEVFSAVLHYVVGIIPFVLGVYGVYHAIRFAKPSGRRGWWLLIVFSSFLFIFGGFCLYNPWLYDEHATIQVIGGTLMYSALLSGISLIWIWPFQKN